MSDAELPIFQLLGAEALSRIVAGFYRRVPQDPILGPMYPPHDLAGAEHRLRTFLIYRFGGPPDYLRERGHPRLRMRHVAWQVGERERDAWLSHMLPAVARLEIPEEARMAIWDHLERAAHSLVNHPPQDDSLLR